MARVTGKFNADDFDKLIRSQIEQVKDVFTDATEDSADLIREIIQTSGRPTSRGTGRIDTGAMLEGVSARIDHETDDTLETSFGWDIQDFERPYPIYQDEGFTHVPDGAWIPGMHALQDARAEFQIKIRNALKGLL